LAGKHAEADLVVLVNLSGGDAVYEDDAAQHIPEIFVRNARMEGGPNR